MFGGRGYNTIFLKLLTPIHLEADPTQTESIHMINKDLACSSFLFGLLCLYFQKFMVWKTTYVLSVLQNINLNEMKPASSKPKSLAIFKAQT